MHKNYKITFSGTVLFGFEPEKTKRDIQQLLKLNSTQVEHFFSGQLVVLKKNLSLDEAQKIKMALENKGLLVILEEEMLVDEHKVELSLAVEPAQPIANNPKIDNLSSHSSTVVQSYYDAPSASLSSRTTEKFGDAEEEAPDFFKFSFEGRYGRLNYLNMSWAIYGVIMLMGLVIGMVVAALGGSTSSSSVGWLYLIILPFMLFFGARGAVLRLHDLNKSGWYSLLLLAGIIPFVGPLISLVFSLYLLFARGTDGRNNYGAQPKKGNIIGLILTCISILVVVIATVVFFSAFQSAFPFR